LFIPLDPLHLGQREPDSAVLESGWRKRLKYLNDNRT
jgi:hypothetical protein